MKQPSDSKFLELVPDGWLREYLSAMVECNNEMPLPFHFLAGAVVIGQILGLRCWATLSKGVRIYPNINAMLLSPAGRCRRGEGTKITVGIAKKAMVNVLSGKTTPEGLLDELEENGDTLLYVEELSMLLTKQDFQRPIIPVLTKLLLHGDGPADMRTRSMGERRTVPYVNLSALFTSAPEWFMTTIPEEAFGGGLMSRFLVCCLDEREVHHIDIQADDQAGVELLDALANDLAAIHDCMKGHIKGTDEAQDWIAEWYQENEMTLDSDTRMAPHRNRKPANLLRLAMILSAAAHECELGPMRLQQALDILNYMEPTLIKLYGMAERVISAMDRGEKRILAKLGDAKEHELPHSQLTRSCAPYFRGGTKEMRACLEGMIEKGLVTPKYKSSVKVWPPRSWHLLH